MASAKDVNEELRIGKRKLHLHNARIRTAEADGVFEENVPCVWVEFLPFVLVQDEDKGGIAYMQGHVKRPVIGDNLTRLRKRGTSPRLKIRKC